MFCEKGQWVVMFRLRRPIAFLSLSLYDTPGLAPRIIIIFLGQGDLTVSLRNRGTSWNAWNPHSGSLMVDTGILFNNMNSPLLSDPFPVTVSSQPIRFSIDCITLIPNLAFTKLRVSSMKHLQRVWHASKKRLSFRTHGSVPLFGTCFLLQLFETRFPKGETGLNIRTLASPKLGQE